MGRMELHCHSEYSNLRLLDSIATYDKMIERAIQLKLQGIAFTDHECLSGSIKIDKLRQKYKETYPDFKIAIGNEIYLTDTRESNQKYYHFILIAKDSIGHKMLRELSSRAWINSYYDRGMERVPTLKADLKAVVNRYGKGHLIASTACLGSELDFNIIQMHNARHIGDKTTEAESYNNIIQLLEYCLELFGDDFYLEVQPAQSKDQLIVNNMMKKISDSFKIKIIITTDAHYIKKEDRYNHAAFLNSKGGERETDEFYAYAYLQSTEEIIENLQNTDLDYYELEKNTLEIYNKIESYSLHRSQQVPQIDVYNYPKVEKNIIKQSYGEKYQTLNQLYISDNVQERYWINSCVNKLQELNLYNDIYIDRLEEEARTKKIVGQKIGTCMFAYPIFLQHYINLFWECGSPTGVGRGCFLPNKNNVLMSDGQTKLIENIKIGDYVRTIDGSNQRVLDKLEYDCNEEIYKITVQGMSGQPIYNTNNHEYWSITSSPCPYDRKYCSKNCKRKICKYRNDFTPRWVRADNLRIGDYVFYPKAKFSKQQKYYFDLADFCTPNDHYVIKDNVIIGQYGHGKTINRFINIDENFMYFIGVMIGDGWTTISDGGKIGIAFNNATEKDKVSMDICLKYLKEIGLNITICKHKTKKLNQVYGYCKPFALLIEELIGKGVENKHINSILLYDNNKHMLSLLKGLLASDGSYDKSALRFSYDSINYNLICQIKMLCSYLGLYTSITTRSAYKNCKESYKLRASGPQLNNFIENMPLLYPVKSANRTQKGIIVEQDGFWVKIENIAVENYSGKVYDLTVEKNHNYIVNNVVVHNSAGAGLNHYLLGVTQTDPIKTNAPWFRYMNENRLEPADIDIDLAPSKRELIFEKIREERGQLGCVQVCNFGTATSKSAVLIACRGYRNEQYQDGIDNDTAAYLSSLIPQERGALWSISDVVYGNEEKDRKPVREFINVIKQYEGLLEIIEGIEGLIVSRGVHASGVIFYDNDPYETACFMKATSGAITTQYDLHDAENAGDIKYDFLVTQQMDIIAQTIQLLQKYNYIDSALTLKEAYDKYLHPDVLPLEDEKLWDVIDSTDMLALFQFNTDVGGQVVRKLKPRNVEELTACNALTRLTGDKGAERPADRYYRLKNDISQWYQEMDNAGLTQEEQKVLEKYMLTDYGAPSSQEVLMTILMDKDTCNFNLDEANNARKIVAKKQMNKINELKQQILNKAKRRVLGEYIWQTVIMPQASYSFSRIHGYSYSLIACQGAYLYAYFPAIYWNTAYLRVISGIEEDHSEETLVSIYESEQTDMSFGTTYIDLPDRSGKIKKTSFTNYNKLARGVGEIINYGINISLIDINKSDYMFEPDEENNAILYGMRAITGLNGDIIDTIINNRPYNSLKDFMSKVKCNKTVMVALIKSGAFDSFGERKDIMSEYIWEVCEPKKRITMQNFNGLNERNLLPNELDFQKRVFIFNKMLKKHCKIEKGYLSLVDEYYTFYSEYFDIDQIETINNVLCISETKWKKQYDKAMLPAKTWITNNKQELLDKLNNCLFQECWEKYAEGSYSTWEMAALSFYHHPHELANINYQTYNIHSFNSLSDKPIVDYSFKRNGRDIPIFKTCRICGTVIAKEDNKHIIYLLTPDSGVVSVKCTRDFYARINKQISELGADGIKHVKEKGFTKKGTLLVVNGFRRDGQFVLKAYKKTNSHQLYKINKVYSDGTIDMEYRRYGEE